MALTTRGMQLCAASTVLGLVLLGVAVTFGFEEPNSALWILSVVLVAAGPLVVLTHVMRTKELPPGDPATPLLSTLHRLVHEKTKHP